MGGISYFRQVFPCGLVQPVGAFRSGADALWLAQFAAVGEPCHFADIGAGCGIVGLALALAHPHTTGLALEREAALVAAAEQNITQLGLESQLRCVAGDAAAPEILAQMGHGLFDLVVANPPYRLAGQGRPSPQALRQRALASDADSLAIFFKAAACLLRHHGSFACILSAARLGDALRLLPQYTLGVRRMRCVYTKKDGPATRILLEARKNAAEDICLERPLFFC